jgi:predicted HAD superfamily hydrolase
VFRAGIAVITGNQSSSAPHANTVLCEVASRKVCSFDVFDTCVFRGRTFPSDVFSVLARRLLGESASPDEVEDFKAARIEAERRARAASENEEITLEDIWHELCQMFEGLTQSVGIETEMQVEESGFLANVQMLPRVEEARASGARIAFISDTYLPTTVVFTVLKRLGFALDGDGMYVSSEWKLTKLSGRLFSKLIQEEGIAPTDIWHVGDDPQRDGVVPRELGLRAEIYRDCHLNRIERALVKARGTFDSPIAELAQLMREFRLSGKSDAVRDLAAGFLGPFALVFASWVLGRARAEGLERLYFVSRDLYLVCKVARALAPRFGNIDCRYLEVSRQALTLPVATEISARGMPWMERRYEVPMLARLLGKLDLEYVQVEKHLKPHMGKIDPEYVLTSRADWQAFWHSLNQEPLRGIVCDTIERYRALATGYLERMGLFEPAGWALVDLGWYLTGQMAISRLLATRRPQKKVFGLYLGLVQGRLGPAEAGNARALFHMPPTDAFSTSADMTIFERVTLLEHVVSCSPKPAIRCYKESTDGFAPVFYGRPRNVLPEREQLETLTREYAIRASDCAEAFSSDNMARTALNELIRTFFGAPRLQDVRILSGIAVSVDQDDRTAVPLASPMGIREAIKASLPRRIRGLLDISSVVPPWWEGSLALSSSTALNILRARAALRKITARDFSDLNPFADPHSDEE